MVDYCNAMETAQWLVMEFLYSFQVKEDKGDGRRGMESGTSKREERGAVIHRTR